MNGAQGKENFVKFVPLTLRLRTLLSVFPGRAGVRPAVLGSLPKTFRLG
jgi:hypothetical protein